MIHIEFPDAIVLLVQIAAGVTALIVIGRAARLAIRFLRSLAIAANALVELYPILMDIGRTFNDKPGYFKGMLENIENNTTQALRLANELKLSNESLDKRVTAIERKMGT